MEAAKAAAAVAAAAARAAAAKAEAEGGVKEAAAAAVAVAAAAKLASEAETEGGGDGGDAVMAEAEAEAGEAGEGAGAEAEVAADEFAGGAPRRASMGVSADALATAAADAAIAATARHVLLFCALCTRKHTLLPQLFGAYAALPEPLRPAVLDNATGLVRVVG
jgi:symplekin